MLVLSINPKESVTAGVVKIHNPSKRRIKVAIDAPQSVKVVRSDAKKAA